MASWRHPENNLTICTSDLVELDLSSCIGIALTLERQNFSSTSTNICNDNDFPEFQMILGQSDQSIGEESQGRPRLFNQLNAVSTGIFPSISHLLV